MSVENFERFLRLVRNRQWRQLIVRYAAAGIAAGCLLALLTGMIGRIVTPSHDYRSVIFGIIGTGCLSGLIVGLIRRPAFTVVAASIDRAAHLKDRTVSALQFAQRHESNPYEQLQIRDATRSLVPLAAPALFPWRWYREGTWAVAGLALSVAGVLLVFEPQPADASLMPPPAAVVLESQALQEELDSWDELAGELESEEMKELSDKLRELVEQMEQESTTTEEAMVQLARMTAAVNQAAQAFDPLLLEQAMQQMAQGFTGLEGFEQASALLKQQKYEQAAESLERFGEAVGHGQTPIPSTGGLRQIRMGQLSQQAQAAGLGDLAQALSDIEDAIRRGSRGDCKDAMNRLGKTCRKYGNRMKVGRLMRAKLARLNECKSCMRSGYCAGCMSGKPCQGGGCRGRGKSMGMPQMKYAQSDSPSHGAGTAVAMNKYGERTDSEGYFEDAQITGQLGAGEVESEIEVSHEGTQSAGRHYRNVYAKYRKMSDAALTEEAIPLAHRHIIKRYFEMIHPDRVDPSTQLRDIQPEALTNTTGGATSPIEQEDSNP